MNTRLVTSTLLASLAGAGLAVALALAADRERPLALPVSQTPVQAEDLITVNRMNVLVKLDVAPPGQFLPDVLFWTDISNGTHRFVRED